MSGKKVQNMRGKLFAWNSFTAANEILKYTHTHSPAAYAYTSNSHTIFTNCWWSNWDTKSHHFSISNIDCSKQLSLFQFRLVLSSNCILFEIRYSPILDRNALHLYNFCAIVSKWIVCFFVLFIWHIFLFSLYLRCLLLTLLLFSTRFLLLLSHSSFAFSAHTSPTFTKIIDDCSASCYTAFSFNFNWIETN